MNVEKFVGSISRVLAFSVMFLPLAIALDVEGKELVGIPIKFLIPFFLAQAANIFYGLLAEIPDELKKK